MRRVGSARAAGGFCTCGGGRGRTCAGAPRGADRPPPRRPGTSALGATQRARSCCARPCWHSPAPQQTAGPAPCLVAGQAQPLACRPPGAAGAPARPPSLAPDCCLEPAHGPPILDPHSCVLTRIPAGRRPLHCRPPSAFREACWSGPLVHTYQFFLPFCGARKESRGRCSRYRPAQAWETLQTLATTATATAVRPSRAGQQQPRWQTADLTATDDGL